MAHRLPGTFVGPAMLARLVANKTGKSVAEVEPILDAWSAVVTSLLKSGVRVRCLIGYFEVIKTKASRRTSPMLGGAFVKVPSKKKIVFRESRKK